MDKENYSKKDELLYWLFIALGTILILVSFFFRDSVWTDLLINIGATFVSTSVLAFLFQHFSSQNLSTQIIEIHRSLTVAQRSFDLGISQMWRERRDIHSSYCNEFVKSAESEVCLLGIAMLAYAEDRNFHRIVSEGISRGCSYRILLLDPKSNATVRLDQMEGGGKQVQGRIERALKVFQSIKNQNKKKFGSIEIRVTTEMPHLNIVRSDFELMATHYMPPLLGYELFTIHLQKVSRGVFVQYEEYFESLWESARVWKHK